jgi:hypothetical protein
VKSEPNSARASPNLVITNSAPSSRSTSPQMRSPSAIPSTPPPSQPAPVVTSQPEASTNENDRGDLIEFYNKVSIEMTKTALCVGFGFDFCILQFPYKVFYLSHSLPRCEGA